MFTPINFIKSDYAQWDLLYGLFFFFLKLFLVWVNWYDGLSHLIINLITITTCICKLNIIFVHLLDKSSILKIITCSNIYFLKRVVMNKKLICLLSWCMFWCKRVGKVYILSE